MCRSGISVTVFLCLLKIQEYLCILLFCLFEKNANLRSSNIFGDDK